MRPTGEMRESPPTVIEFVESAELHIDLNLMIRNNFPALPTLSCVKKTGRCSKATHIAISIINHDREIIPAKARIISNSRFEQLLAGFIKTMTGF